MHASRETAQFPHPTAARAMKIEALGIRGLRAKVQRLCHSHRGSSGFEVENIAHQGCRGFKVSAFESVMAA